MGGVVSGKEACAACGTQAGCFGCCFSPIRTERSASPPHTDPRGKLAAEGNEEELVRRFMELELARDDFAARLDDDASYTVSTICPRAL